MKICNFISLLLSKLKCAFCENTFCEVRFYPKRMKYYFYNGKKYFVQCEKDVNKYYDKMFKL